MDKLGDLDSIPAADWEYYDAWMQCIKIRHLVRELQETMHSRINIHELVEKPILNRLAEEIQELWWHTAVREEDLQIQHFDKLWNWEKKATEHYSSFKLSLNTRVFNGRAEYKLTFQNFWNGEIISQSDQLPVQAQWCPVDNFWLDSRRYDYAV